MIDLKLLHILFLLALVALFAGNLMLGREVKKLLRGFLFIFALAALALWVAKIPAVKYYGFEAVFFSLAFVCIGLDTRLKEIVSKENRNTLFAFLIAQTFDIVVTFVLAYILFGLVK